MGILFFWLLMSMVAGVIAHNKGRSGIGYFILSVLLSPLIGIIIALIVGKKEKPGVLKKCPYCAEYIQPEAIVCKHCGKELSAEKEPAEISL